MSNRSYPSLFISYPAFHIHPETIPNHEDTSDDAAERDDQVRDDAPDADKDDAERERRQILLEHQRPLLLHVFIENGPHRVRLVIRVNLP